jgi:hypothetical protein
MTDTATWQQVDRTVALREARDLEKLCKRRADIEICLVSRDNFPS